VSIDLISCDGDNETNFTTVIIDLCLHVGDNETSITTASIDLCLHVGDNEISVITKEFVDPERLGLVRTEHVECCRVSNPVPPYCESGKLVLHCVGDTWQVDFVVTIASLASMTDLTCKFV